MQYVWVDDIGIVVLSFSINSPGGDPVAMIFGAAR